MGEILDLNDRIALLMGEIAEQREEILRAFIAKYGLNPGEVEQVLERQEDGNLVWYVRRRKV